MRQVGGARGVASKRLDRELLRLLGWVVAGRAKSLPLDEMRLPLPSFWTTQSRGALKCEQNDGQK